MLPTFNIPLATCADDVWRSPSENSGPRNPLLFTAPPARSPPRHTRFPPPRRPPSPTVAHQQIRRPPHGTAAAAVSLPSTLPCRRAPSLASWRAPTALPVKTSTGRREPQGPGLMPTQLRLSPIDGAAMDYARAVASQHSFIHQCLGSKWLLLFLEITRSRPDETRRQRRVWLRACLPRLPACPFPRCAQSRRGEHIQCRAPCLHFNCVMHSACTFYAAMHSSCTAPTPRYQAFRHRPSAPLRTFFTHSGQAYPNFRDSAEILCVHNVPSFRPLW